MGLMLSVLVMCVGVLEAISSVQHIRESFLSLDTTRRKRRMVVDLGTGNVRHADISWPGDVPRGSHVIKKRSGLTSPHSSFDVPDDDELSRRCSEHFDSAQLERAVSAILIEEDNSSDETSEEVTQILSGVRRRLELSNKPRDPQKSTSPPEPLHETFAPINEARGVAERVPETQPLSASEAYIVDLKSTERLIKYPLAETELDEYDSSESSEKYSREKRSVSKSETSISYGSELLSSSLSSEILSGEEGKFKPCQVLSVTGNDATNVSVKDEIFFAGDDPESSEAISDLTEPTDDAQLSENISYPQRQLSGSNAPIGTPITSQSLTQNEISPSQNDEELSQPNGMETFPHRESIVELIESTNNMLFSDDVPCSPEHSDSIVELIHSTNSLVFVPDSASRENGESQGTIERQESIEELVKFTNNVILSQDLINNPQTILSINNAADNNVVATECQGESSVDSDEVMNGIAEQDTSVRSGLAEKQGTTVRSVETSEKIEFQNTRIHPSGRETSIFSPEISTNGVTTTANLDHASDAKSSISLPEVFEINIAQAPLPPQPDSTVTLQYVSIPIAEQSGTFESELSPQNVALLPDIMGTSSEESLGAKCSSTEDLKDGIMNAVDTTDSDYASDGKTSRSDPLPSVQPEVTEINVDQPSLPLEPDSSMESNTVPFVELPETNGGNTTANLDHASDANSSVSLPEVVEINIAQAPLPPHPYSTVNNVSVPIAEQSGTFETELSPQNVALLPDIMGTSSEESLGAKCTSTDNLNDGIMNDVDTTDSDYTSDAKTSKSDPLPCVQPEVTEINVDQPSLSLEPDSSVQSNTVPVVELPETVTTEMEPQNDGVHQDVLKKSSSEVDDDVFIQECLETQASSDEIDCRDSTVTRRIQSSSSSSEGDSGNSVTTIIMDCVQTIVDIGPTLESKKGNDELMVDHDEISEGPCTTLIQAQQIGVATPKIVSEQCDENMDAKCETELLNKPRNDEILVIRKIEDSASVFSPNSVESGTLTTNTPNNADDVKDDVSHRSNGIVDDSLSSSPEIKETISTAPILINEKLCDQKVDSVGTKLTLNDSVAAPDQQDDVTIIDESAFLNVHCEESDLAVADYTAAKQPVASSIIGSIQTELVEQNDDLSGEIIEGKQNEKEIVSDTPCTSKEPKPQQSGDVEILNQIVSLEINLKKEIMLKSENIALTSTEVEYDTHKLPESASENEVTEAASVVASSDPSAPVKEVGETKMLDVIQSGASSELSEMNHRTSERLEPEPIDDGAVNEVGIAEKTADRKPEFTADSKSAPSLSEAEHDENPLIMGFQKKVPELHGSSDMSTDSTGISSSTASERKTEDKNVKQLSVLGLVESTDIPSGAALIRESEIDGVISTGNGGPGSPERDLPVSKMQDQKLPGSQNSTPDSQSIPITETQDEGTVRTTNEFASRPRASASEVKQHTRRVSSIDEGEVVSVEPSQNRPAEMEDVEDVPSTSPDKAFWLIFSGEYTKAMSKDWHSGHFCCWQCDESLTGQRYVLRDDHPYCIKCYESVFANTCDECNKTIGIDSKDLSYKDKHWHEACFFCNKCRVSLVDKQFGSKADKIYCGNCYDAQFASRCDGCGQIFRAGTKKMEYKTRQWHEQCFCCCVCKSAIGTKSFIPREQEIYCATCYEEKFATRCVKCNKIITSGGVTYKNEPWHRECFTCTNCNTSLAGQRFTSRDEKPYCADCFGELFAKRCTSCCKPITGIGGTRFISFEDRHWHNDCFICATCKTSLVGRGFITDAEEILCTDCAKQKLM